MWGGCGVDVDVDADADVDVGANDHLREARQLVLIALATKRLLHEVLQLGLLREATGDDAAKDAETARALELP